MSDPAPDARRPAAASSRCTPTSRRPHETRGPRLVLFLRVMAALSMAKGLYHWAVVCGIGGGAGSASNTSRSPWQTATVFFAVIDLVAAVGLWLAAAWGAVVWLTSVVSMVAVECSSRRCTARALAPGCAGVCWLLGLYLCLAVKAAQEHPPCRQWEREWHGAYRIHRARQHGSADGAEPHQGRASGRGRRRQPHAVEKLKAAGGTPRRDGAGRRRARRRRHHHAARRPACARGLSRRDGIIAGRQSRHAADRLLDHRCRRPRAMSRRPPRRGAC